MFWCWNPSRGQERLFLYGEIRALLTSMVSSDVWCPAAWRHGYVFWKTFRALLRDSASGRLPVANERFSHSFPYALKCQRKCPSDSNYRCYLGVTAALLLNTWNWQQAGCMLEKEGIGYSASPSYLQHPWLCSPAIGTEGCKWSLRWTLSHCHSALQIFLFPAETPGNLVQRQSIHSTKLSHGWIWMGICRYMECSQRIKCIFLPQRKTAGDVLQSPCYLFHLFNILTVKPLELGLPKILLFLPTYPVLSTCLRRAFLAWQGQRFIPLLCLGSCVLQHGW